MHFNRPPSSPLYSSGGLLQLIVGFDLLLVRYVRSSIGITLESISIQFHQTINSSNCHLDEYRSLTSALSRNTFNCYLFPTVDIFLWEYSAEQKYSTKFRVSLKDFIIRWEKKAKMLLRSLNVLKYDLYLFYIYRTYLEVQRWTFSSIITESPNINVIIIYTDWIWNNISCMVILDHKRTPCLK